METVIRKGKPADLPEVHALIRELAVFEKAPDAVTNTVEQLEEDGFGKNPVYGLLVAEHQDSIVGMAIYFTKYSTWKGKGLYLDDIVVSETFRGQGIGTKLFEAVLQVAREEKMKTMHWQVLDWNTPAIDFYKKYGASLEGEWLDCKLTEEQIAGSGA